ncbi:E3 ubiquitin/ISG15 ligase TRIM25-like isoform X2 [Carcharodon carcharias]|uniref:E3 ubiquitin/ISG15 ligase TRIM25-like isoform X2 n=1 Tax=Carcharodon carcharias TaxID=13397 RepID=UPI001B7E6C3F|nr:E3 ubiquitin/ISG15 ligase TRIM25-like isoform X2 [Carcharodon carcharias]
MEARALEEVLNCAVCLQVYKDPVTLPCQHSFCLKCIEDVWNQAVDQDGFSCPQCHKKFNPKPSLERGIPTVTCDYCIESPSPAVKTCLKCETSFCSLHLKPHLTKETFKDHKLADPVTDLSHRKCADHKKTFEFFCQDDGVCVCSSCAAIGRHKSHAMVNLDQAETSRKKLTRKLKGNLLQKFSERRKQLEEDEQCVWRLIDEEELCQLSEIRRCSGTLDKMVEQLKLINKEAQKLMQEDCISFIQNSKEHLSSNICQKQCLERGNSSCILGSTCKGNYWRTV